MAGTMVNYDERGEGREKGVVGEEGLKLGNREGRCYWLVLRPRMV